MPSQISTEVSDLADNPYGEQPLIDLRNAQTSIELPSGGSMMLAGLIKNSNIQSITNTPGLRSIPILGALFSSQSFQRNQSELVVIVSPYVVGRGCQTSWPPRLTGSMHQPTCSSCSSAAESTRNGLPGSEVSGTD